MKQITTNFLLIALLSLFSATLKSQTKVDPLIRKNYSRAVVSDVRRITTRIDVSKEKQIQLANLFQKKEKQIALAGKNPSKQTIDKIRLSIAKEKASILKVERAALHTKLKQSSKEWSQQAWKELEKFGLNKGKDKITEMKKIEEYRYRQLVIQKQYSHNRDRLHKKMTDFSRKRPKILTSLANTYNKNPQVIKKIIL